MDNTSWRGMANDTGEGTMFCLMCGEKIPSLASFCPYCGFRFDNNPNLTPDPAPIPQPDPEPVMPQEPDPGPVPGSIQFPPPPPVPDPGPRNPLLMIIAAIVTMIAAALVGFLVIAPMLVGGGKDTESGSAHPGTDVQSAEVVQTAEEETVEQEEVEAEDPTENVKATPTPIPTATATPTPTMTPTPTVTPTPTEPPQQSINQVNIIDASTGQLIYIPNDTASSYAYPDSGTRSWSYSDVDGMTAGEVRYCINEIYARHGYIFQNDNWLTYFKQKTWYTPSIPKAAFSDNNLNSIEVANVKLLNQYYENKKFPEY